MSTMPSRSRVPLVLVGSPDRRNASDAELARALVPNLCRFYFYNTQRFLFALC
jgi:hypothetical protein